MSNVFGSCKDKHTLWTSETDPETGITSVTFTSNVEGQEDVTICFGLKGAEIVVADGDNITIEVVDGILQLPEDMFGSGVLSEDGETYTITFPGQDPQILCVNPLKAGQRVDAEGNPIGDEMEIVDGVLQIPTEKCSTTVPFEDAEGEVIAHDITTDDNITTKVCVRQYKGLLDNGDGTWTEQIMLQNGAIVLGETIDFPTTGEPQLSTVDSAGNTTYVDSDGNTQTVPATDVDGNPVDPSQGVWNFIDGNGQYLGSKPCKDETVLVEDEDGVLYPINPDNGNQILPKAMCCGDKCVEDAEGNTYIEITDFLSGDVTYYDTTTKQEVPTPAGDLTDCKGPQTIFKSGETLPDTMSEPVTACTTTGVEFTRNAGGTLSNFLAGCVYVDPSNGVPAYIPPKATPEIGPALETDDYSVIPPIESPYKLQPIKIGGEFCGIQTLDCGPLLTPPPLDESKCSIVNSVNVTGNIRSTDADAPVEGFVFPTMAEINIVNDTKFPMKCRVYRGSVHTELTARNSLIQLRQRVSKKGGTFNNNGGGNGLNAVSHIGLGSNVLNGETDGDVEDLTDTSAFEVFIDCIKLQPGESCDYRVNYTVDKIILNQATAAAKTWKIFGAFAHVRAECEACL